MRRVPCSPLPLPLSTSLTQVMLAWTRPPVRNTTMATMVSMTTATTMAMAMSVARLTL